MSTALTLLSHVWGNGKKDTWERINHSMRNALSLAIGSGLSFEAADFAQMGKSFRWGHWVTESTEWIYHEAIINGNDSCVKAYEEWKGRTAFHANDVGSDYCHSPYLHRSHVSRKRERLAVGLHFPANGRKWYVTGFDDDSGHVRLASYHGGNHRAGKPEKLLKLSHAELKEICPAPKKAKVKQEAAQ